MSLALALLLSGAAPVQSALPENIDFHTGTLDGWQGSGFHLAPANARGPSLCFGVSSGDGEARGNTGLLYFTFQLPANAGVIRFRAHAVRGKNDEPDGNLDVLLLAPGKRVVPKQVQMAEGWKTVPRLLHSQNGRPREYLWNVSAYAGQTLRIVLVDEDKRPGCHLFCSGFRLIAAEEFDNQEFGRYMLRLVREHRLPPAARFESKHFVALSNADDHFTALRLNNCELIYDIFLDYFRRRGFALREPPGKLMVAIFDSQAGFEAYLAQRMPPTITGIYHLGTNRLVVYDYGQNNAFVAQRQVERQAAQRIGSDLDRRRYIETANRRAQEFRTEANIGTVMHEVAHQLSFNTGMLNRDGDVPFWVAEGLACFCEATQNGSWQGIGEANPERLDALRQSGGRLIPLHDLITRDDWLDGKPNKPSPLLAYAQAWALFHMLMNERPHEMRSYLATIYPRQTAERRLADFTQAFGGNLNRLELRYGEYVKELVQRHHSPRR
jgi:hypothetical protein